MLAWLPHTTVLDLALFANVNTEHAEFTRSLSQGIALRTNPLPGLVHWLAPAWQRCWREAHSNLLGDLWNSAGFALLLAWWPHMTVLDLAPFANVNTEHAEFQRSLSQGIALRTNPLPGLVHWLAPAWQRCWREAH